MPTNLSDAVERIPKMEARTGVTFQRVFAYTDDEDCLHVNFEVSPQSGDTLSQNIQIVVAALDSSGRIIDTSVEFLDKDSFFGMKTVSKTLIMNSFEVSRIRLHPELWG